MAGKVNPIQSYQEATNQLLAINEQRKGALNQAKMEENLEASRNNTLAQASEFIASQPQQVNTQAASLNPATQNILGRYGLGQPKMQRTSSSSQTVTKQNVVINNKNTNITNNNVSVPANIGGPVQSRPVQFQDPGQIKFKTWLSNSFAQQNEQAAKRQREYEKRDSALIRNSNKLMKRLEETGKKVATSLNPKNMASNVTNQLKTLFIVLGLGYIAKNWPKVLDRINNIQKTVTEFKDRVVGFFSEGGGLVKMLGGNENEKPFEAFKNLFIDKDTGILAYVKKWLSDRMSERSAAIQNIPKPDLSVWNPSESIGKIINYLGDILGAILDPTKAGGKATKEKSKSEANTYLGQNSDKLGKKLEVEQRDINGKKITDENGNPVKLTVSQGEQSLLKPTISQDYYGGLLNESVNAKTGNLKNTAGASISQGNALDRVYNTEAASGNIQTASAATGLTRLYNSAKANKSVILSGQTLKHLISEDEIKELGLKKTDGYYVSRPKTDLELAMDYAREIGDEQLLNNILGFSGAMIGAAVGSVAGPAGTYGGFVLGGAAGEQISMAINRAKKSKIPKEIIEIQTGRSIDLTNGKKLVGPVSEDDLYELNESQVKGIIRKITQTDENVDISLDNHQFVSAVEQSLMSKNKSKTVKKDIDISKAYAANIMHEENVKKEAQMWENNRAHAGAEYTGAALSDFANNVKDRVSSVIPVKDVKKVNPSDVNSGDLSGVIAASKRGVFYSNSSGGYIPLGKDLKGFMHKCTSGPATFYEDGSGGKIKLNGKWWNTGSPKTATGTNIDKEGFKCVWTGTHKEGWDTNSIRSTGFELQPGDIMLNFGYSGNGTSSHAEMWNGEEWISDTHQGQRAFVYRKGGRLGSKSAQIWRYDAGIGKQDVELASEEVEMGEGLLDNSSVEAGDVAFENESPDTLPIPFMTGDEDNQSESFPIPTYNPFANTGTSMASNFSIPTYNPYTKSNVFPTFTPENTMADNFPSLGTNNSDNSASSFEETGKSETHDYTRLIDGIDKNTGTSLAMNKTGFETIESSLEEIKSILIAGNNKKSTENKTNYVTADSMTDNHFNSLFYNS